MNRGNCDGIGLEQYEYDFDLVKQHEKELCAKYKDKGICDYHGIMEYVLDKQGKKISKKYNIYSDKENMDYFNNLHDDFKKLYRKL